MNISLNPLIVSGGVLCLVNLYVSVLVIRSHFYSAKQKSAQCAIVWLVPIFGAIGIWSFLRAQYKWEKYNTRAYPERAQRMVAVEVSNAIHENAGGAVGD